VKVAWHYWRGPRKPSAIKRPDVKRIYPILDPANDPTNPGAWSDRVRLERDTVAAYTSSGADGTSKKVIPV